MSAPIGSVRSSENGGHKGSELLFFFRRSRCQMKTAYLQNRKFTPTVDARTASFEYSVSKPALIRSDSRSGESNATKRFIQRNLANRTA